MDNIELRLAIIKSAIQSFKEEQENIILRTSSDFARLSSSRKNRSNATKLIAPPSDVNTSANNTDEGQLTQILDTDVIIMPVSPSFHLDQRLWPQALAASNKLNAATLGNIESSGTLWRIVERSDNYPGFRVYLRSAEIGQEPKYLSPSLGLVKEKNDAAIWNMRSCVPNRELRASQPADASITKGVYVCLELVDSVYLSNISYMTGLNVAYSPTHTSDFSSYPRLLPITHASNYTSASLLTSSYSQISTEAELVITTVKYMKEQKERDELRQFCIVWEVCPESWINDDVEFLDRFLA